MRWAYWVQVSAPPLISSVIWGESLTCSLPDDTNGEMEIILIPA